MAAIVQEAFGLRATGGLHIPAARLWLDGLPRDGIALRSHLARLPKRLHRIVCSSELAALMGQRSPQPLVVPWATPLQLGRLTIELLPAGSGPGSALLRWHLDGRTLIYAAAARPEPLPTARPLELAAADVLVLDAELAEVAHASPAALQQRVDEQVRASQAGAEATVWLFDRRSSALDVAALVGDRLPLYGHQGICDLAARYLAARVALPRLRCTRLRPPLGSLLLWPLQRISTLASGPAADLPRFLVQESCDAAAIRAAGASDGLALARRASGVELDLLARRSGAADVVAFGAGAAALCERLERDGLRAWHLMQDPQLALV